MSAVASPSTVRRVAVNTGSQALARAVSVALSALTLVVLTRYLGVDRFGVLVAALAYISLFSVLVDLGTDTVLVRRLSASPHSAAKVLGEALGLRIVLAAGAALAAAAVLPFLYDSSRMRLAVLIVLPTILFGSVSGTLTAPLQASLQMRRVAIVDIAVQVLTTAALLALVSADLGLYALLATGVVAAAVRVALVAVACRGIALSAPQVDFTAWRGLLMESLPLAAALVLNTIYVRIDTILLSILRGAEDTGIYGLAYRFLDVSTGFTHVFVLSLFPLLAAAAHDGDLTRVRDLAKRGFDMLVLVGVPLVAATTVVAPELVRLAAGDAFTEAVLPLRVLIVAAALMPVNGLLGYLMIAMRRERDTLWLNVLALALNIGLNVALIPSYGVAAAAWVATGSELVILVSGLWLAHRYAGFVPSISVAGRGLAAGAVMVAVMVTVGTSTAPALVGGFSAYLGALYLLRVHTVLRGPAA